MPSRSWSCFVSYLGAARFGAGWAVAYSVKRKAWFAWVTAVCFLAAIACGALMGSPDEWLVLALGLFGLVALPGYAVVRQGRGGQGRP